MAITKYGTTLLPSWTDYASRFFDRELEWPRESQYSVPQVNIQEREDDFQIDVAAPGMKKDDFNVTVDNNMLTINAQKQEEADGQDYSRREFNYQSFSRSFTLPESVKAEDIAAKYEDGILKLTVPKREESKQRPPKTIQIS